MPGPTRTEFPGVLRDRGFVKGAEIGVQNGDHARMLLDAWTGGLLLVDPWVHQDPVFYPGAANVRQQDHEAIYRNACDRLAPYGDRARIVRAFSVEAARDVAGGSLDFVYLDGNHTYEAVTADLAAWHPKVRSGGIMAGHDFTVHCLRRGRAFGVRAAVIDFLLELPNGGPDLHVGDEEWPTWYWVKG